MQKTIILSSIVVLLIISCNTGTKNLDQLIHDGKFSKAIELIDLKLENKNKLSVGEIAVLQKKLYDIKSVINEYTLSYDDLYKQLKTQIPNLSAQDMKDWKDDYSLEYYLFEGEKKYYYNCIFDLFQVNKEASKRAEIRQDESSNSSVSEHPLETILSFENDSILSKKISIVLRYFQDVTDLPDKSVLRAWIPFARENKFQSNIKIINSSINKIELPKTNNLTSMIYFDHIIDKTYNSNSDWINYFTNPFKDWIKPMKKPPFVNDSTFVFQFIYEYESKAYYKHIYPEKIEAYKKSDVDNQPYTKETVNNQFTPYLKNLSQEIVGKETNHYLKAKKIYEWICENIIWTDPKPVLGDYAEYTARYKRGDCSAKSNLFISLCRINKIPAREQGGWLVRPNKKHAQHSWAQVYFEPYGWLPVDVTMGKSLINNPDKRLKYFYFGNCTPYHLIVYDDNPELFPEKTFNCIYGGGSQLGAFEWKDGDLEPYILFDSHVE
jgi:hypothetical protein